PRERHLPGQERRDSSMTRFLRLIAASSWAVVGICASSCSPDQPLPLGNLNRPSGLLYIDRGETADGSELRGDLYFADSLAQGLRVIQFDRIGGILTGTSTTDDFRYIPAPIIFFPLVIPTEGFPTRLALSRTSSDTLTEDRIYALAPTTSKLY